MNKDKFTEIINECATKCNVTLSTKNINDILKACYNTSNEGPNNNATNKALLSDIIGTKKLQKTDETKSFIDLFISAITGENNRVELAITTQNVIDNINILESVESVENLEDIMIKKNLEHKFSDLILIKDNLISYKDDLIVIKDTMMLDKEKQMQSIINSKDLLIEKLMKTISDKDKTIECHLEVIQKLIKSHENISSHEPIRKEDSDSNKKKNTSDDIKISFRLDDVAELSIEKYDDTYFKVVGKTYPYRSMIKQISGATWSSEETAWLMPLDKVDELSDIFKNNNINFKKSL